MPNNNIQLITKYSTEFFDKVYKQESRFALLDAPKAQVQWTGAKTVKIGKFQSSGLSNYYRNNEGDPRVATGANNGSRFGFGYGGGNVGFVWEEFTVSQDRGAQYPIEQFDNEEVDGQVLGAATTEINRTQIVPEIDAYGFSKVASYCSTELGNLKSDSITKDNVYEKLNDALLYMDNHEVEAEDQIIFVSPTIYNILRNANKDMSRIVQSKEEKGVKFSMGEYEGREIVSVAPSRFRTLCDLTGQGISWGANSKAIDFMVVSKSAVMHVVKYNKVKILEGDVVTAQGFDGYIISARVYHDVFVLDNKRYALYCNAGTTSTDMVPEINIELDASKKVTMLQMYPTDQLVSFGIKSGSTAVTSVPGTVTSLKVGDTISATSVVYAYQGSKIVATKTVTIAG